MTRHSSKRRRRQKSTAPAVPPRPPKRPPTSRLEERPQAPWHPFPLVELAIFIGVVCIVVGLLRRDDAYGRLLLALGFALGALGGLDTAAREHFAGYRSHTLVLAAFPAVAVGVLIAVAGAPLIFVPAAIAIVFAAAFALLRRAWRRTKKRSPA